MTSTEGDPRDTLALNHDVRPIVAVPRDRWSSVAFIAGAIVVAACLFLLLDARRRALTEPRSRFAAPAARTIESPPPLIIPAAAPPPIAVVPRIQPLPPSPPLMPPPPVRSAPPIYDPPPVPPMRGPEQRGASSDPALVVDLTLGDAASGGTEAVGAGDDAAVRATIIRHRSSLVPQGTLIAAVLETPIDSSKPGLARAIVSRDARGFDGARVLIPRGSRLIGDYRSDIAPGQKRVLVTWTRLIRPDGVAIRIGSPGADLLGGTGLVGRVNTHFFERFANAVLQSALTAGVNLASQPRSGSVYVGIPGQVASAGQSLLPNTNPSPTINVRQGTEIAIFVARDLDFGGVGTQP